MEDKNSIEITKLNAEYLELYSSKIYQKALKKERIKSYIKTLDFKSIYLALNASLNRKKLIDKNIISPNCVKVYTVDKSEKIVDYNIVIYTCIIGNYDLINEPRYINDKCRYVVITDQEIPNDSVWEKIDINMYEELNGMSNTEKNRYVKLNPHKFFPEYDWSVYVDGNIIIVSDMLPIIKKMNNCFLGIHRHPQRDCIYTEAKAIINTKKANKNDVYIQIENYKNQGYPEHNGLYENTILVRKHNDKRCKDIMNEWWENMTKFTMRDQLSLPYVIWKNNIDKNEIYIMGDNLKLNPRFRYLSHNK